MSASIFIITLIIKILQIYQWIFIIRAISSFFVQDFSSNPLLYWLYRLTEPVLAFLRERMPFLIVGMLDLSILAVYFLIYIIQVFLQKVLVKIAYGF
ncbi:MAG TPA: YggT family protein [Spirochaetia bacterium]|nr:MAG: hypothetical protein A2Y41_12905 [Spirochaetes bacterium GWB1_36_13]HCL55675.1 YggT family protein [Spirochaetia bacterium]